jgi:hypothetical protein
LGWLFNSRLYKRKRVAIMAIGSTTSGVFNTSVELMAARATISAAPALVTDGLAVSALLPHSFLLPSTVSLFVNSTAGSGAMSVTARLWGYHPGVGDWMPLGIGTDDGKGVINAGSAIGESLNNKIRHTEPLDFPTHFTRVYLQLTAIAGTATSVEAHLSVARN